MTTSIIVSAANAPYFPFVWGLAKSVAEIRRLAGLAMAVLDTGLTEAQVAALADLDVACFKAGWDFQMLYMERPKEYEKAYTARPHLPTHLPGHEVYLWLDADTWVQRGDRLIELIEAARLTDVAVAPEVHAAYDAPYDPGHWLHEFQAGVYKRTLGAEEGADLTRRPLFNAGVIAARGDSPFWPAWVAAFQQALYSGRYIVADQTSLNQVLYRRPEITRTVLSPHYNWICNLAPPLLDEASGLFVEPIPPYAPIGILHLTGHGRETSEVRTRAGGVVDRPLTWPEPPPDV